MGKGVQVKSNEDGGVQEAIGGSRVDQRLNRDRRLARNKEMHQKSEMARGGEREGRGGMLGPLPIVTSAPLVIVPNSHLCASRL